MNYISPGILLIDHACDCELDEVMFIMVCNNSSSAGSYCMALASFVLLGE